MKLVVRLLTEGLLVRILPGEPTFSRVVHPLQSVPRMVLRLGASRRWEAARKNQLTMYVICVNTYALCVRHVFSTRSFLRSGRSS